MTADLLHLLSTWAWRTSLEALPLALIAILFWRLRGLPAAWRWWLPALFFLRLAMPQVPEIGWHQWRVDALAAAATASADALPSNVDDKPVAAVSAFAYLPLLWALGCAGVFGWLLVSQWRLRRYVARCSGPATPDLEQHAVWAAARMGLSSHVPLRVMPGWSTMAIRGWLRPELLIPADLSERFTVSQIRGMFLHEMAHVRRRDVLWTWLALGLCALHWFNPLAWLALRRFHADRELACDAAALRALEPAARRDYGEALLRCLECPALRTAPALAPFFRRFPELKQRLQNIMTPASPTALGRLLAALLIPSLIAITFTTARAQKDGDAAKPAAPDAAPAERPLRDGEKPKTVKRDGEGEKSVARDGDQPREGQRDGEVKRKHAREGDVPAKEGPRDGDQPKKGMRDANQSKAGLREGDGKKAGPRDGDQPRKGARDGEGATKSGSRDGDIPKTGPREGDAPKAGPREGDRPKADGEKPEAR
ncbi:MAG: M56 family metallopeptidase [Chthoniobacteraceae bacterium]